MHKPSSSITYTFSASAGTIQSAAFEHLEDLKLIVNLTRNVVVYNPMSPLTGGTLAGSTLTLVYDTTEMNDSDLLQIYYDDADGIPSAKVFQGDAAVAPGNPLSVSLPAATVTTLTPPAPISGFATSAKQDSQIALETQLETLIETLQELTLPLAPLAGSVSMVGGQALRVQGVSMPSTAVTGPITSALSIAEKAIGGVAYPEKIALTNMAAQANINNCVGV